MIDDSAVCEIACTCSEYAAPFKVADMLPDDLINICIDEFLDGRKYPYYCAEDYFLHRYLSCVCCMIRAYAHVHKLPLNEHGNPVDYDDVLLDLEEVNEEAQRGLLDFGEEQKYSYDEIWYVQSAILNLSNRLATELHDCDSLEMWGTRQMLYEYGLGEEPTINAESSDTSTVSLELSSDCNSSYSVTPTEALESSTLLSESTEDS